MSLFIAVPAYDRKVTAETARCLLDEQAAAALAGIKLQTAFVPGCSLITHARNQAVEEFLESGCDRLVFIDSDIAWPIGSVLKLASFDEEFVGGAYRYKDDKENYPVAWADKPEIWSDARGLIEVKALPGGFLCLKRSVFEKLKEKFPDRSYQFHGKTYHAYFHCPPGMGEDGAFCMDWGQIGSVWLDPSLTLTHCEGPHKYTGTIGTWLKGLT